MMTGEGRVRAPLRLPEQLFRRLEAEATRRGEPIGRTAGNLIASVIPQALYEVASSELLGDIPEYEKGPGRQPRAHPDAVTRGLDTRMLPAAGPNDPVSGHEAT